eukprot:gnl/TRDRNA2_/TRDRNA2_129919_c0_seq1.p2 gnl/TRDRNA2_/TRDRNA2_129919_c0~~gnl/TRDRNA2_/TRDRNA2_129919_c0_seq1.p2  ORF type:complete len:384 (-),score=84.08 gnl/TRDRNA2_/TRDRNA2_129919_c0_seq1:199-1350(-)
MTTTQKVCTNVDFLGVTQESRFPFIELPFDGIFGLGLDGLSAGPNFNFVSRLKTNSTISDPVFSVFLRDLNREEDSEITFGGWRQERLAQDLTWLPVPKDEAGEKGYWLVSMRDVYVRGKALGICDDFTDNPRCKVAMDTGSSLMMGPPYQVNQLLKAIGLEDNCASLDGLPTLRFVFDSSAGGTFNVDLTPEDYAERDQGVCATAFTPIALPPGLGPMWVFGQTALRKYYTVYDAKRWRVGIGLAQHTAKIRPPPTEKPTPPPEVKVEKCEDDNKDIAPLLTVAGETRGTPGCKNFQEMGYCQRFPPLANHYCRLSCKLCTPPAATTTAPPAGPVKAQVSQVVNTAAAGNEGGVTVKGGGIVVATMARQVLGKKKADGEMMF